MQFVPGACLCIVTGWVLVYVSYLLTEILKILKKISKS